MDFPEHIVIEKIKKQEKDFYSKLCELLNNLEDDLELDLGVGENGYKTYEESHKATKKYTRRILRRMVKKQKDRLNVISQQSVEVDKK